MHNKAGSHSVQTLNCTNACEEWTASEQSCLNKPIEVYLFIDPLCPECWALEPIIKKLQTQYGNYFKIVYFIGGKIETLKYYNQKDRMQERKDLAKKWEKTAHRSGMSCDGDIWFENPISSPFAASVAIKAAEFQGRKAGARFLRKIREYLFLEKQNITEKTVLMECADKARLDLFEFENDLYSDRALKAFQCDLKISSEMDIYEYPTLVFFNENIEEAGIKVSGIYSFDVYLEVMSEVLNERLENAVPPPLEQFLAEYEFVASQEIAVVYDMTIENVEREMKKLLLKQKVERVPVKYGTFWRYKDCLG